MKTSQFLERIYQAYRCHLHAAPKTPENARMVNLTLWWGAKCLRYQEKLAKIRWCIWNEPFSIGRCCFSSVQQGTATEERRCKMKRHFTGSSIGFSEGE